MFIKQVVSVVVLSSLICALAHGACAPLRVVANAKKQAEDLIVQFDSAKTQKERACHEKRMRDLLRQLKIQSKIYAGATDAGAMSGELIASNVNADEQADIDQVIALYEHKLKMIDAERSSQKQPRIKSRS